MESLCFLPSLYHPTCFAHNPVTSPFLRLKPSFLPLPCSVSFPQSRSDCGPSCTRFHIKSQNQLLLLGVQGSQLSSLGSFGCRRSSGTSAEGPQHRQETAAPVREFALCQARCRRDCISFSPETPASGCCLFAISYANQRSKAVSDPSPVQGDLGMLSTCPWTDS